MCSYGDAGENPERDHEQHADQHVCVHQLQRMAGPEEQAQYDQYQTEQTHDNLRHCGSRPHQLILLLVDAGLQTPGERWGRYFGYVKYLAGSIIENLLESTRDVVSMCPRAYNYR